MDRVFQSLNDAFLRQFRGAEVIGSRLPDFRIREESQCYLLIAELRLRQEWMMSQSSVDIQIKDEDRFQVSPGSEGLVNGNLFNPIQLDTPTSMERRRQFCFAIGRPEPGKLSREHGPY